ncbi:MAG: lysylphosphatidylglycerol synthase transmembrane domain-containing protein [Chloroflexota bacterium]
MKDTPTSLTQKSIIPFWLKLIVSLGLLAYLFWLVDWQNAFEILSQANKGWIISAPIFIFLGLLAGSLRWKLTLADSQVYLSYRKSYFGYLTGMFYNIFLPGAIGGDVVRIGYCVTLTGCEPGTAVASVLLERIAGVVSVLSFILGTALFIPAAMPSIFAHGMIKMLTWAAIIWIAALLALMAARQFWTKWGPKGSYTGLKGFIFSGMQTLNNLQSKTILALFLLSIAFQGVNIVGAFVLSRAIGENLPLSAFFAVLPIVYLATLLPISLGGLGVREGSLVFLLAFYSVPTSEAITLSFLIYLNQVFVGLIGGLLQLGRLKTPSRPLNNP